ncbi:MAG TPA: threonine/serine dehydratase, partial [Gemmatimonadaceae bacterium]|nr:threonine/serine dehydratase [Gemmatimonadaceae bacterium]
MTHTASTTLVSLDDIRKAAAGLRGVAVRTPLLPSDALEALTGVPVFLKPEMLQPCGAFKLRGAYWFVSQLSPAERAKGLVAPSSGNHGQAVALAAKLFGVRATVVMPTTAPRAKREGAERLGARVVFEGTTTAERMARAREICDREGATLVPPYDDAAIIAGQGTAGLEIAEDLPDVGMVLVQVGGGGLSAGVAAAVKQMVPAARVVCVEPEGSPKLSRARAAGEPVTIPAIPGGLADGLLAVRVGSLNFEHHQAFVDDVVQVSDAALARAVRFLLDRHKLVTEPSGAITVAALLEGIVKPDARTVCVLSGGNVEWEGLLELIGAGFGG